MITCPTCGGQNRSAAQFCNHCGADLSPTRAIDRIATAPAPARQKSDAPQAEPQAIDVDRLAPFQPGSTLFDPHDSHRQYGIVTAHELDCSIYYDALDLICPTCGTLQPRTPLDGLCLQCQLSLQRLLIHERRPRSNERLAEADVTQLIRLSAGHSDILLHRAIIQYQETVYTVTEHPGRWSVPAREWRQRSPNEALAGAIQIGQALAHLHDHDFAHSYVGGASSGSAFESRLENIIVVDETNVKLGDLSTCTRLQLDSIETLRAQVDSDVVFLAYLLFYLSTGKDLTCSDIELAPPELRLPVERAMQGQYASAPDILADLTLSTSISPARSLKPAHGQATHPGQKHVHNEDAVVTFTFDKEQEGRSVPVSFYLVADGMGGHDAGDLASRTVNQSVTNWIIQTKVLPNLRETGHKSNPKDATSGMLAQAIRQANETLVNHGQAADSDLGSTVAAALVIGNVATIVSVGDSRTYLLRGGQLEQITQDHSLVARLVDAGIIKPEDVRSHPHRNQIYRCLGHKPDVEVDTFSRQLQAGDVLIICSDGLWEMVLDDEIQRIVENTRSPQKACDALIEAANRAGGEDNIAVIVVEME